MTKRGWLPSLALMVAALGSRAATAAQYGCNAPFTNEWMTSLPENTPVAYDSPHVFPVLDDVPAAIAMVDKTSIVPLRPEQVRRFIRDRIVQPGLRPYLVRAVFPTPHPRVGVAEKGGSLIIFADGLGCAPYVKHPLVIFLHRKPKQVFVFATAAL